MSTIVTRSGKGAALTYVEVDANFTNLNADKAATADVILATQKGAASGVCPLDSTSKVSSTYLPSYVDDVLEYANYAALPATGETGKIYVALDTNKTYRWSGSAYIYITSGAVDSVAGRTGVITLTSTDVGLANANNTTDANKPISTATQTALDLKASLASPTLSNPTYTGTLTGGTGVVAIGTNQIYKDAAGNVGIGTSSPANKLDVVGRFRVEGIVSDTSSVIEYKNYAGNLAYNYLDNSQNFIWQIAGPERMRITSAGGVSFGATGTAYGTSGQVLTSAGNAAPTWVTPTVGTVTSVTGTAPVVSSGGTTPAISMAAATASVNGYMTLTYATKLDGITAGATANTGTVTSVAALTLGTTGTDVSSTVATGTTTPVITLNIPTASATNRGALSSTDWGIFNGKQAAGAYLTSAVTSVGGTGTVSGLTLTGTVTSTGSLTLGGTLALGSLNTLGTAAGLSATLIVGSGGTGVTTLTGIPYGNGTSAFTVATAAQLVTAIGASTTLVAGSMSSADKTKLDAITGTNTGDQIIPTTLPASDVSAWAKASTKPSYSYTEVGAQAAGTYASGTGSASGVNTGDQTLPTLASLGAQAALGTASATVSGILSSTDWSTFNGKQAAGTYATGTGSASGTNTGDQVIPVASSTVPAALGVAAVGTGTTFARADHVHLLPTLATLGAQAAGTYATGTGTASGTNTGDQTTITGNSGTATSVAGQLANSVLYQSGVGVTANTGVSTVAGQVLTTVTAGGAPTWVSLPAFPSGTIVGTTDTQTITNKRITSRAVTTTSSATPTINTDVTDIYGLTALAVAVTSFTTNLTGTPTDGQKLWIYIVGTAARAITWGASFETSTTPLPTTTVTTARLDIGFVWNATTSKWRCMAVA